MWEHTLHKSVKPKKPKKWVLHNDFWCLEGGLNTPSSYRIFSTPLEIGLNKIKNCIWTFKKIFEGLKNISQFYVLMLWHSLFDWFGYTIVTSSITLLHQSQARVLSSSPLSWLRLRQCNVVALCWDLCSVRPMKHDWDGSDAKTCYCRRCRRLWFTNIIRGFNS